MKIIIIFLMVLWSACSTDSPADFDTKDAGSDTDTDSDSDTDADSDTDSDTDADSDTDSDTDADSDSDTDSDIDADSDSDTDSDTDIDTDADSDSDAGTDADTDTDSDTDTSSTSASDSDTNCPWDCRLKSTPWDGNYTCDTDLNEDSDTVPDIIRNFNFDCGNNDEIFCCQPINEENGIHDYCNDFSDTKCAETCEPSKHDKTRYCRGATYLCCRT